MGRIKKSTTSIIQRYIRMYGQNFKKNPNKKELFCNLCSCPVLPKKSVIEKHISSLKHKSQIKKKEAGKHSGIQKFVTDEFKNDEESKLTQKNFNVELCGALLGAGIPLKKINNKPLKNFLNKWTHQIIPDESTLRKNYLPIEYEKSIERIREDIGDNNIWVSVDETIDSEGRAVGNVIVGALSTVPTKPYLLNIAVLDKVNNRTISLLVNEALQILYPNGIIFTRLLLLLTDAAAYMIKSGQGLQSTYPKMIHLTCLAHGLHRVAEQIRSLNPEIDSLISSVKKVCKIAIFNYVIFLVLSILIFSVIVKIYYFFNVYN